LSQGYKAYAQPRKLAFIELITGVPTDVVRDYPAESSVFPKDDDKLEAVWQNLINSAIAMRLYTYRTLICHAASRPHPLTDRFMVPSEAKAMIPRPESRKRAGARVESVCF
jgi:hypothetical protein